MSDLVSLLFIQSKNMQYLWKHVQEKGGQENCIVELTIKWKTKNQLRIYR